MIYFSSRGLGKAPPGKRRRHRTGKRGEAEVISVTRLLCDSAGHYGDSLRYSRDAKEMLHGTTGGRGPVVVWNCTRTCNLNCIHCYSSSGSETYPGELSTEEAYRFIDDLADFDVPVLLFSGGEPLLREDLFELLQYAGEQGIRATLSTNGTLIDREAAGRFKALGLGYVGVSLDGVGEKHDRFRGQKGAFDRALQGIRNCFSAGLRVGLRFTVTRHNLDQVPEVFRLLEEEGIPRLCFYHLVYSGRGSGMVNDDIGPQETRELLDDIMEKTRSFEEKGQAKEILTVDNHADGIYMYLQLIERDRQRAEKVRELLEWNGGNRSGIAISAVDHAGNVHPDQFTPSHTFGNVKQRRFGEIWTDISHPVLGGLKNRKPLLKGRCRRCRWLDLCNGNFRSRAEAVYGDFWAPDPACFLTDEEISAV